jgi:peptide methionine sulfoxide reductase MsrA
VFLLVFLHTAPHHFFSPDGESIRITFDPSIVSYQDMLEMMFDFHTPADPHWAGTQYRSAIFVHNEEQRQLSQQVLEKIGGKIATFVAIEDAGDFYKAEEYHQKYVEKAMSRRR